ncbi:hypothetical protein ACIRD6_37930, partial [Streptomyces sp. NPDC102473]
MVLGTGDAPFRTGDAHAKRGRERYGLAPRTRADFAAGGYESGDRSVPLDARASLLALTFVLARERVFLRDVGPLRTTRYADDAEGAADLALLVGILVRASARVTAPRRAPRGGAGGPGARPGARRGGGPRRGTPPEGGTT